MTRRQRNKDNLGLASGGRLSKVPGFVWLASFLNAMLLFIILIAFL